MLTTFQVITFLVFVDPDDMTFNYILQSWNFSLTIHLGKEKDFVMVTSYHNERC